MFFNESVEYGSTLSVQPSETGLTPDLAGVYRMIAESTEDWYNLREKMMRVEHVSIIREDAALLQEGAKDFFGKISGIFKKMLAKIKEIWQKFTVWISNAVMNDKDFVKKYEKVLRNKSFAGFETKGKKWRTDDLGTGLNFDKVLRDVEGILQHVMKVETDDQLKSFREAIDEDHEGGVRGLIIGKSEVDAEDFSEAVRNSFFVGDDSDVQDLEAKDLPVGTLMEVVKNADKNIKSAQKEEKAIEKLLEEAAKFYDGFAKKLEAPSSDRNSMSGDIGGGKTGHIMSYEGKRVEKNGHHVDLKGGTTGWVKEKDGSEGGRVSQREAAQLAAGACRKSSTICSSAFGMLIGAIKERRSEFRSHLAKMVSYKAKSENYDFVNESGILDRF
jgi:hypothetical protein